MEKPVKIGLLGAGTVGSGVIQVLQENAREVALKAGAPVKIQAVLVRDAKKARQHIDDVLVTDRIEDILEDEEIKIVVELMGGLHPAREYMLAAMEAGKHVVTANKALMATCGEEIMALAAQQEREIAFEASVGGGIPIIGPLKHSLIANEVSSVMGIVNGTTNYMLTRMANEGISYEDVLAEAQAAGYAEADPTADVDGLDAAAKIAILASLAFNTRISIDQVQAEGIRSITTADLAAAADMGYCVKLLAVANRTEAGIDVRVHPAMVPLDHPLATVSGVYNAIYVVGDFVGQTMFFGEGAGSDATASAVIGDVMEVARHVQAGIDPILGNTYTDKLPLVSPDDLVTRAYIRFTVAERPGVLAAMSAVFAEHGVSVHSVIQRGKNDGEVAELVYVTHSAREGDLHATLDDIAKLENVLVGPAPTLIRVIK